MYYFNNKKGRFYLPTQGSPTCYNLRKHLLDFGWKSTRFQRLADFSEHHLHFDPEAAQCLEYKHLLAQLVSHYCPEVMPFTQCINDFNWTRVINDLRQREDTQARAWILKPALLNNGQGIKIFRHLNDVEHYYSQTNRLGGEHVLQAYLACPHLLRDHRKYSIRQLVVISSDAGAFLYKYGYFNVALQPFSMNNFNNLNAHLTNEHLFGEEPNVIQIPTREFSFYLEIYWKIKRILMAVFKGFSFQFPDVFHQKNANKMAFFGFDFMVDEQRKVWLIEANHGPCFPVEEHHPLQVHLYNDFWRAVISQFILPQVANSCSVPSSIHPDFECLNIEK